MAWYHPLTLMRWPLADWSRGRGVEEVRRDESQKENGRML